MNISVNNKEYETRVYRGEMLDMYLYKGVLYDDLPKGCSVKQYYVDDDGSGVGVCSKKTWRVCLIGICLIVLAVITVYVITILLSLLKGSSEKSDVKILDDSTENAVVSIIKDTDYIIKYNRYTVLTDGYIDIMYQNIDEDVEIYIEDVDCEKLYVKANDYIPSYKVSVSDSAEFPIRANLIVMISGDKYVVPIVINDLDSLEYQALKNGDTTGNRVNLKDSGDTSNNPDYEDEEWSDPSTFATEERAIHD